ncbi:MAG: NAD(P)/FAD-dependent oxidoreductase [Streptosporangiales bacterium]|nr:NAD(P)/FAD-dependent oxidoreductase [Streptosporangiales bacterium]
MPHLPDETEVAVIGSGFSGLGAAIRLRQDGVDDVVVLERADDIGGTWRDNTYPGAACDVPSHLYSFGFAPNPEWSHSFSRQPEILAYLRHCAGRYGLLPRIHLGHEVLEARWDDAAARWTVRTTRGTVRARVLVSAAGPLSDPALPDIPGLETFTGTLFHSGAWDHGHDLTGERVAVVGTGASAAQFVPEIQPLAGRLHVFQRTPSWVLPRRDRTLGRVEKRVYRAMPALQRMVRTGIYLGRELYVLGFTVDQRLLRLASRIARGHLERQVPDPELRAKLTPAYTMGCKRIVLSDDFYPALGRPNVEVVTDRIERVGPRSVVTAGGVERPVDTIICATGFRATDPPIAYRIHGRGGRSLADAWRTGMRAYKGTTVSGFPNLFLLLGPNTGGAHTSVVLMAEAQHEYLRDAVRFLREHDVAAVDVRPHAMHGYDDAVARRMDRTVWVHGGCRSWYLDRNGRNTTLWPSFVAGFRRRTARFDRDSYRVRARAAAGVPT